MQKFSFRFTFLLFNHSFLKSFFFVCLLWLIKQTNGTCIFRIKVRSIEVIVFCFVYDNFRVASMAWNSYFTWWFTFFFLDFGFYWAHRLAHGNCHYSTLGSLVTILANYFSNYRSQLYLGNPSGPSQWRRLHNGYRSETSGASAFYSLGKITPLKSYTNETRRHNYVKAILLFLKFSDHLRANGFAWRSSTNIFGTFTAWRIIHDMAAYRSHRQIGPLRTHI